MNDITTGAVTVTVPTPDDAPAIVDLAAGMLPCRLCGIAVDEAGAVPADPLVVRRYGFDSRLVAEEEQPTVLCSSCVGIEREARRVIAEQYVLTVPPGRVVAALRVLDMLGGPAPTFTDDEDVRSLVEHVPAAELIGFAGPSAKVGTCSSSRWAHVSDGLRRTLREGAARWMRTRLERPTPVAPPATSERRGCVLCGVGTVPALPSRAGEVWTECYISAASLGGGNGAQGSVDGHTCPACSAAIAATDRGGVAAVQAAVLAFIGYQRTTWEPIELTGVRGWGLRSGATPNRQPWAHVDLAGLRRSVAAFERGGAS